ncbi:hypothetical protein TNCV_1258941 [Trichonephila clavipes]|nr:hypothetical protein TNCV_1258941 [Trichonephila clavipes]
MAFTQVNSRHNLHVHDFKKPYTCKICNKGFSQNGDLKRHLRIHSEEKPYVCEMCNKGFSQSGISWHSFACVKVAKNPDTIFMVENTRVHAVRFINHYVEHETLLRMVWPARSPDLSPIEHVRDRLWRRLSALINDLTTCLKE